MLEQLDDLGIYQASETGLLLIGRSILVCFRSKVMRVLLGHQVEVLFLDGFDDLLALWPVSILDHGLDDAASVVLVAQFLVLVSDECDALLHELVLLVVLHLTLLHQQSAVVDLHESY